MFNYKGYFCTIDNGTPIITDTKTGTVYCLYELKDLVPSVSSLSVSGTECTPVIRTTDIIGVFKMYTDCPNERECFDYYIDELVGWLYGATLVCRTAGGNSRCITAYDMQETFLNAIEYINKGE